ncbi:hypothetical protein INR49_025320, partial [Caranx melampygus]
LHHALHPAVTQPATSPLVPSSTQVHPPAPETPPCSYTVTTIKFGLQIDISSSNSGDYTINLKEQGQPGDTITVQHSNQNSSHQIKHLKPCTEYEHNVIYLDGAGGDKTCRHAEDKTRTTDIKPEKILDGKVTPSQPEHNAIRVTCSYDYNKLNDDRKERKFRANFFWVIKLNEKK